MSTLSKFASWGGLVALLFCSVQPSEGTPIRIALTGMNTIGSSDGNGGGFSVIDETGYYGTAGANLQLSAPQISLWTTSGDPAANTGLVDPIAGTCAITWSIQAAFNVLNASGTTVGTGTLFLDAAETGTYDPVSGMLTSGNPDLEPAQMVLSGGSGRSLTCTVYNFPPYPCGGFPKKPQPSPQAPNTTTYAWFENTGPALTLNLPTALGAGQDPVYLTGTFDVESAPELSTTWLLLLIGLGGLLGYGRWERRHAVD